MRWFWMLQAAGWALWFSDQVVWIVFDLVLQRKVPAMYPADALLFLAGAPMFAGLLLRAPPAAVGAQLAARRAGFLPPPPLVALSLYFLRRVLAVCIAQRRRLQPEFRLAGWSGVHPSHRSRGDLLAADFRSMEKVLRLFRRCRGIQRHRVLCSQSCHREERLFHRELVRHSLRRVLCDFYRSGPAGTGAVSGSRDPGRGIVQHVDGESRHDVGALAACDRLLRLARSAPARAERRISGFWSRWPPCS